MYFHLVLIGLLRHISLHRFSTEFAFKTPRAVTRVPPPAGARRMTVAMQTRSIPQTLHCHAERGQGRLATTVTGLGVQVYGYVLVYQDIIYSFLGV